MLPPGERRQRIRHKLHTPVYASFSGPTQGMVLDLSEVLDLNEDGFAVQTSVALGQHRVVNVCLDLPETKSYVHATGQVVWSDSRGRAGVRLSGLAEQPRRLLKEWLFINLLIAVANHSARTEQLAHAQLSRILPGADDQVTAVEVKSAPPALDQPLAPPQTAGPVADLSGLLFAVDAVRRELSSCQNNFNSALQLLTERALSLTGATGGAIAFLTDGEMLCRACAGAPAPPLGSIVDVSHGFSGECVRQARTTVCEDATTDERVDREICQMLAIRSIMATPVVSDRRVVGLLEVLSPHPRAFARIHEIVLERLAELVPKQEPPPSPKTPQVRVSGSDTSETVAPLKEDPSCDAPGATEPPRQEPVDGVPISRFQLGLLAATVAIAALALGYLLAPTIERHWLMRPEAAVQAASEESPPTSNRRPSTPISLDALRQLAEGGNADAQWNLGSRYHEGDGVPQDDATAVQWFLRAADQGYVPAQSALGAFYWRGRGVPTDLSKAYFWSALATAQGDETSKARLEGLASQMTRAETMAARQQADEWIRQRARSSKVN